MNEFSGFVLSSDTETVLKYKFWNYGAVEQWLGETDVVVLSSLRHHLPEFYKGRPGGGQDVANLLDEVLAQNFILVDEIPGAYRGPLSIYRRATQISYIADPAQLPQKIAVNPRYQLDSISSGSFATILASEAFDGSQNTLVSWIRLEQELETSPPQFLFQYYVDDYNYLTSRIQKGHLETYFYEEGQLEGWIQVPLAWRTGEWHHLAYTLDLSQYIDLYIDGRRLSRISIDKETPFIWPGSLWVNSLVHGELPAQIQVSQLTTYAETLSPPEIYLLYITQRSHYQPK